MSINEQIQIFTTGFQGVIVAAVVLRSISVLMKCHSEDLSLKEGLLKVKKYLKAGIVALVLSSLIDTMKPMFTNDPFDSAQKLIRTVINILIGLESTIVTYKFIVELLAYKMDDESQKPQHAMNAKHTIIVGIIVITITGVMSAIFNFYK